MDQSVLRWFVRVERRGECRRVSCPMVNPLVKWLTTKKMYLYKFDQFYGTKYITNAQLHKFQQIDQRKKSKSPQYLDNQNNGRTLELG